MNEIKDKKNIIIPIVTFLLGLILGSVVTIFLFPAEECPQCADDSTENQISTEKLGEVEGLTITEDVDIEGNSDVSLPVSECSIVVDISGAIKDPGVYCFVDGSKLVDVVKRASGFAEGVAYKYVSMNINLSELITNHQKIYIPYEEDVYCEVKSLQYINSTESSTQQTNSSNNQSDSTQSCININTATKDQLITLDGVGESTAQKIIDARPFTTIEDILDVSGIGESTYEKFKDDICVY
ncbi:MAG: ComEA family DNA-binding protein [Candidatus Dojkabacteria bacterium]|nr:ComEA family DNA-binding protein [Candidatus Dojkabacteria bacterium]